MRAMAVFQRIQQKHSHSASAYRNDIAEIYYNYKEAHQGHVSPAQFMSEKVVRVVEILLVEIEINRQRRRKQAVGQSIQSQPRKHVPRR